MDLALLRDLAIKRRQEINRKLYELSKGRVLTGPFKGMQLAFHDLVKAGDFTPKVLGTYEQELHGAIEYAARQTYESIINVGSGDGYYAVGMARINKAPKVYAFDGDRDRQEWCRENAQLNGVSSRIFQHGECGPDDFYDLVQAGGRHLIIMDCEGAEIDLLSAHAAVKLECSDIIVESHDFLNPQIAATLTRLLSNTHKVERMVESGRDPNRFSFMHGMASIDRWLAVCEFRPCAQHWFHFASKKSN